MADQGDSANHIKSYLTVFLLNPVLTDRNRDDFVFNSLHADFVKHKNEQTHSALLLQYNKAPNTTGYILCFFCFVLFYLDSFK